MLVDRVLILPDAPPKKTASGALWIPEAAALASTRRGGLFGQVEAVGPKCRTLLGSERVIFGQYAGDPLTGTPFLVMREADVLAIIENGQTTEES